MNKPTVAVIGASRDRSKYGNKSVRAHAEKGYEVYPVHPAETEIEGFKAYRSVLDIPVPLDRVTVYLPPRLGLLALEDIAAKGTQELFINPGAESPELIAKAQALGLEPILACSIVAIGATPSQE
ncbi:MAG: CoA-binding protein [Elusimicrobia bacterium]|nr:CoA-binding protein [Elusimicrobiota bacterium]